MNTRVERDRRFQAKENHSRRKLRVNENEVWGMNDMVLGCQAAKVTEGGDDSHRQRRGQGGKYNIVVFMMLGVMTHPGLLIGSPWNHRMQFLE